MPLLQKNGHWEKRPYANCMWAIWLFSLDMTLLSLPEHPQTIQVSHLASFQVPIPGQKGHFWPKTEANWEKLT